MVSMTTGDVSGYIICISACQDGIEYRQVSRELSYGSFIFALLVFAAAATETKFKSFGQCSHTL